MEVAVLSTGPGDPVASVYLLHGRGDSMRDWTPAIDVLDQLTASRRIPPLVAVMPDAPSSSRAGYWVDSLHDAGAPIETALIEDLVPWVDAMFPTLASSRRVVAGYSMGGAGAVRMLAAHPDLFPSAIALSPAVYHPLPPPGSSTRQHGAFGVGATLFDPERYRALGYSSALDQVTEGRRLYVAYGDREYRHPDGPAHDIDVETAALAATARERGVDVARRGYSGGHDWDTWRPALRDGLLRLLS